MPSVPPPPPFAIRLDAHAHVFDINWPMTDGRRYTPPRSHGLEDYLALLDSRALTHGLLVQPSFYGTDNGYLLDALDRGGERVRGVAVVDPTVTDAALADMAGRGVIGIRYNLIGQDPHDIETLPWRTLSRRVAALGWHIEVQAEGPDLAWVVPRLLAAGGPVVVDHFGKPDPSRGLADPGFRTLLAAGREGAPLLVKLSAPYRCHGAEVRPYAEALLDALGPERLLWGSDWPWTQHEAGMTYDRAFDWLADWVPDREGRSGIRARIRAQVLDWPPALMW